MHSALLHSSSESSQPGLAGVFIQRHGSRPYSDDELIQTDRRFQVFVLIDEVQVPTTTLPPAFNATNQIKYRYFAAETDKNGGQYVIFRNLMPATVPQ